MRRTRMRTGLALVFLLCFLFVSCTSGIGKTETGKDTDAAPLAWPTPEKEYLQGVDVSRWQGEIDWARVKDAGIGFAIIRVGARDSSGNIVKDEYADYNMKKADEAGIFVGAYFYSGAVNVSQAKEEAAWLLDAIRGFSVSAPVVFDHEKNDPAILSAAERTDIALAFLSDIEKEGYDAALYGSVSDLSFYRVWQIGRIEPKYRIWAARYPNPAYPETKEPGYAHRYDIWQYTNAGEIDGISRPVDVSVAYYEMKKAEPKDPSIRPDAYAPSVTGQTFSPLEDRVTAKEEVVLRRLPGVGYEEVGTLCSGEYLTRTGIGDMGWSRLIFNGQTVYAVTSYLTGGKGGDAVPEQTFTHVQQSVSAKDQVNLRQRPTTDSAIIGVLQRGMFLTRTGIGDMGWSRLTYNGQNVYAVTSYLTEDPDAYETEADPAAGHTFREVNERVTAKEETNLREAPSTDAPILLTLLRGEYVTRTGIGDKGWSRLSVGGKNCYAVTTLLLTEKEAEAAVTDAATDAVTEDNG